MSSLEGRVAVVTGGGRGIGAAVAELLAREGASVVVNDLGVELDGSGASAGPAREVTEGIEASGGRAVADTHDITDYDSAGALVHLALDRFGHLDVLVNVAGIVRDRMIFNMSPGEWDDVIRVHLRGTFNTTRHAAEHWRSLRDPDAHHRLINFTSSSGLFGAAQQPNYAAAKMGIVGLTYSCANALRRYGVTSNAIAPLAHTRMASVIPAERRVSSLTDDEGQPHNVAPIVAYLASKESSWINGQVLGASGYQVSLYNRPAVVSQIASDRPWDLDRLSALIEKTFGAQLGGSRDRAE